MATDALHDNQLIIQRAADTCRVLDDLRHQLHTIQKKLARARTPSANHDSQAMRNPPLQTTARDELMASLLNEAYTLQFQISTLLAATEEPILERQRIQKQRVHKGPLDTKAELALDGASI
ncbi:hypothetical protein EDD11_005690 [Mortierella claussenii]|nr:hypothetical protein EDD11_005690 [Mortierella claussenii]